MKFFCFKEFTAVEKIFNKGSKAAAVAAAAAAAASVAAAAENAIISRLIS